MENKNTLISNAQIIEHRNENYKLLMLLKSGDASSLLSNEEIIKKLEFKIKLQDEEIRQLDKRKLYAIDKI